jgi:hypothetical protein
VLDQLRSHEGLGSEVALYHGQCTFTRAPAERWLDDRLKIYTVSRRLIVDEIGSPADDRAGADLSFQPSADAIRAGPKIPMSKSELRELNEVFSGIG